MTDRELLTTHLKTFDYQDSSVEDLADFLLQNGWVHSAASLKTGDRPLSDYQYGDMVVVTRSDLGEVTGRVSAVEPEQNLVYVDTDRGPVSVRSTSRIRLK